MGFTAKDFITKVKWYAVRKGRKTGLFTDWETCKAQVYNFPVAEYKGFKTKEEAEAYLGVLKKESSVAKGFNEDEIATAYVDGSFNLDEWKYGSGVYFQFRGKKIGVMNFGDDEKHLRHLMTCITKYSREQDFCRRLKKTDKKRIAYVTSYEEIHKTS